MPWSALLSTWCHRREHWLFPAPTATTMLFLIAAGSLCAHDLRACSEEVNLMQTRASGAAEATPAERAKLVECVALGNQLTLQIMPTDDGAAKAAGIKSGDWIQTINGNPVSDWEDLRTTIRAAGARCVHSPGDVVARPKLMLPLVLPP